MIEKLNLHRIKKTIVDILQYNIWQQLYFAKGMERGVACVRAKPATHHEPPMTLGG
jgi:hypothetical protein